MHFGFNRYISEYISKLNIYHAKLCSRLWMHNSAALDPDQKVQVGMGVAARQTAHHLFVLL